MLFRHNKTAPSAHEPLVTLSGKLPPLFINTGHTIQWAKLTPQNFSETQEREQPSK